MLGAREGQARGRRVGDPAPGSACPGPGPLSTGETRGHEASQLAIFPRDLPDPGRRLSLGAKEGPGLLLQALGWGGGSL